MSRVRKNQFIVRAAAMAFISDVIQVREPGTDNVSCINAEFNAAGEHVIFILGRRSRDEQHTVRRDDKLLAFGYRYQS